MPAKSAAQARLMGAALAQKRGAKKSGKAAAVASSMSEEQIKHFTYKKRRKEKK